MSTQVLTSTKIVRNSSTKEFIVRAYDQNGKRMPGADYFTTDIEDAKQSSEQMLNIAAMKKGPTRRMSYTLTLTKQERGAIDWIGNRYWHGDDFRKLLWVDCPDPVAVAEDGKWHLVEKDGDDISIEWDSQNDLQFTIPENVAWEISEHISDEDGDNLACFSPEFCQKLYEFCGKIV